MSQLVVLKLGQGSWQQGFPTVIVQLWEADSLAPTQFVGSLPASKELPELYNRWRSLYKALYHKLSPRRVTPTTIEIDEEGVTNVSKNAFTDLCQQLKNRLDLWLESTSFGKVERQMRTKLLPSAEIQVIVETEDNQLQRFPWHLWSFFEDYPKAEVALSNQEYGRVEASHRAPASRVRILAILGNSKGINVQKDRILLEELPVAETVFLVEPQRQELDHWLWHERGWDILFFAGHSTSQADGTVGEIAINPTDSLTIAQLKNALRAALTRGLKLAIFNSCDGLGLARAMAELNIPQMVVMREPVPDQVAQEFLKHLLTALAGGKSFYLSVREAREKLQGLEDQYPCASWLPTICQNPAANPLDWQRLFASSDQVNERQDEFRPAPTTRSGSNTLTWRGLRIGLVTSVIITSLIMGVRSLGVLQTWELKAFDHLLRLRPSEGGPDPRVLVVEVTQEDTNQYGYPIEDIKLTELIKKLEPFRPRAIGLDMHRYQPRGQSRADFIAQFQHQNVFTVCSFGSADKNYAPPSEFSKEQLIKHVGFSDLVLDSKTNQVESIRYDLTSGGHSYQGGAVRRQLLSYDPRLAISPSLCSTPYSLSFLLAFRFLYAEGIRPMEVNENREWQFGKVAFKKLPTRFGGYQQLDGSSSQILINYRSAPPGTRVTLKQVLEGQVDRNLVEDRVILIGVTAPIARENFETPYGEMPGVWIHAHMVSQILSAGMDGRSLIWSLPQWGGFQWGDTLWVSVWSSLGGAIAWRCRSWLLLGLTNVVAFVALHQICLFILIQGGWVPLVPSLLSLLTSSFLQAFKIFDMRKPQ